MYRTTLMQREFGNDPTIFHLYHDLQHWYEYLQRAKVFNVAQSNQVLQLVERFYSGRYQHHSRLFTKLIAYCLNEMFHLSPTLHTSAVAIYQRHHSNSNTRRTA